MKRWNTIHIGVIQTLPHEPDHGKDVSAASSPPRSQTTSARIARRASQPARGASIDKDAASNELPYSRRLHTNLALANAHGPSELRRVSGPRIDAGVAHPKVLLEHHDRRALEGNPETLLAVHKASSIHLRSARS